jgi:N-acetylglucosamine malate deacetylase 1
LFSEANSVLVVAAHPDDETLGCGALLAQLSKRGCAVSLVFATNGEGARGVGQAEARATAAEQAAQEIGAAPPLWLGFNDQRLDTLARLDLIQAIESVASRIRPRLVITHDPTDLNLDHRIVYDAVSVAMRPLPGTCCDALMTFETPSATDYGAILGDTAFKPNMFIDATLGFKAKLAALRCYDAELRSPPHPRSIERIEALAKLRGAAVGLNLAEAFKLFYARGDISRFFCAAQ